MTIHSKVPDSHMCGLLTKKQVAPQRDYILNPLTLVIKQVSVQIRLKTVEKI